MKYFPKFAPHSILLMWSVFLFSCQTQDMDYLEKKQELRAIDYNPDWSEATHGNAQPGYNTVFPQDAVNKIEITMTLKQWNDIRTNMTSIFGTDFGGKQAMGGNSVVEPDYRDVLVRFNGKQWKNVGFRLKGNSSLRSIWSQGNYKLPFRLNFDRFEDIYPGIRNQHFYGFEELSFSPGFKDPSLMHEKLAADIYRMGGIPAPQTAFYRIYIDFGSGLKYCGVYTCVELPDDNMIKDQFGEEKGNIYKPESRLTTFIAGEFEKKNNDSIPDYSDVKSFIAALNQSLRLSNPAEWRKNLEISFNVPHFLKWLAVNNTLVNWDTYGAMSHNYYLYNHSVKKLTWIPWDNNEALTGNAGITKTVTPGQPPGNQSGLSLTMNEVTNSWPLIRYLVDDSVYFRAYRNELKTFTTRVFNEATLSPIIENYHVLISQYVIGADGEKPGYSHIANATVFTNSRSELKTHVANRYALVSQFLK